VQPATAREAASRHPERIEGNDRLDNQDDQAVHDDHECEIGMPKLNVP